MKIQAKLGVFGVLGNHEYYDKPDEALHYLRAHSCYIMKDEVISIPNTNIVLIGRDDRSCITTGCPPRSPIEKLVD